MRPVVILLALLSAAAFLCCCYATGSLDLPPAVSINIKVYQGKRFVGVGGYSKWWQYLTETIDKAQAMLNKFTNKFGTTITLRRAAWAKFGDVEGLFSFQNVEAISARSTSEDINLHLFFAKNHAYAQNREDIRAFGLRGKMCGSETRFRTLVINRYRYRYLPGYQGIHQNSTRSARILAYYVGMLLGMKRDSGDCTSGLMDHENWDSGDDKQTWNNCNANDFQAFFKASPMYNRGAAKWRSDNLCVVRGDYEAAPAKLGLNVLVTTEPGFVRCVAHDIFEYAKDILKKENSDGTYQLGIPIDIKPTYSSLAKALSPTLKKANDEAVRHTKTYPQDLFVFFTKSGLLQSAHDNFGHICIKDKHSRIVILDQKEWTLGGLTYKMSNDGLARQLAQFIARSLGVESDSGNQKDINCDTCADGFMRYKDNSSFTGYDDDRVTEMFTYWDTDMNTEWSKCNAADLKNNIVAKTCLKTARRSYN